MKFQTSFLRKNWNLKKVDKRKSLFIQQTFHLNENISNLLSLMKIDLDNINSFLNPDIKTYLPDPYILKDMEKSVEKIYEKIISQQKIGIIADYDVDGSTSAALIIKFFELINVKYHLEIPDRINEGFGPNKRIIDNFKNKNIKTIISIDCGTSAFNVFNKKNLENLEVIILDHHVSEVKFPEVYSIVNPNRFDENNNIKHLASVGITFLFCIGLRRKLRESNYYSKNNYIEHNLTQLLDLVALGTICDVVSLKDLNRAFVRKGLQIIQKRMNMGITSLIDISKIRNIPTVQDLSHVIGPKLNAGSRIGDSKISSKLLFSSDSLEIDSISKKLHLFNEKRKLIENEILFNAREQAYKKLNNKVLIIDNFNWHPGVIGIVASKIVDEFGKPVVIISKNENYGIGSARSNSLIDLGSYIILAKENGILLEGGGHKMAAGLKILNKNIKKFSLFLENKISNQNNKNIIESIEFDLSLSLEEINNSFIDSLELLEPFGNGNPEPVFLLENLNLNFIKKIKEKHLIMNFNNNLGNSISGICFNCLDSSLGDNLINCVNKKIHVGGNIKRDIFNNNNIAQIIVKDAVIAD